MKHNCHVLRFTVREIFGDMRFVSTIRGTRCIIDTILLQYYYNGRGGVVRVNLGSRLIC